MANQQLWRNLCAIACPVLIVALLFIVFFISIKLAPSINHESKIDKDAIREFAQKGVLFIVVGGVFVCFFIGSVSRNCTSEVPREQEVSDNRLRLY